MIVVTVGGVTIGLLVLLWHGVEWWPGLAQLKKKPVPYLTDLLPFLAAWGYGTLGILTAMGLIGWAFDAALWASNWLGDAALWIGVGEAPGTTASGAPVQLSGLGNCVVLLATVMVIAVVKKGGRFAPAVKRGTWCGLCLGTSAGVAGSAAGPLAMAANWIGSVVYGPLVQAVS